MIREYKLYENIKLKKLHEYEEILFCFSDCSLGIGQLRK